MTPEDIDRNQFTQIRWREGYDLDEVDEFLARARSALAQLLRENAELEAYSPHDGSATSIEVPSTAEVRFTPVRIRAGYVMGEVDAFLERLDAELRALVSRNFQLRA